MNSKVIIVLICSLFILIGFSFTGLYDLDNNEYFYALIFLILSGLICHFVFGKYSLFVVSLLYVPPICCFLFGFGTGVINYVNKEPSLLVYEFRAGHVYYDYDYGLPVYDSDCDYWIIEQSNFLGNNLAIKCLVKLLGNPKNNLTKNLPNQREFVRFLMDGKHVNALSSKNSGLLKEYNGTWESVIIKKKYCNSELKCEHNLATYKYSDSIILTGLWNKDLKLVGYVITDKGNPSEDVIYEPINF